MFIINLLYNFNSVLYVMFKMKFIIVEIKFILNLILINIFFLYRLYLIVFRLDIILF